MTENIAVDTTEVPAEVVRPEVPEAAVPYAPFFTILKTVADEANVLAKTYRDATKGASEVIDKVLTESDNPEIAQWRDFDTKISAKIAELIAKRDEGKESAKKAAAALAPEITTVDLDQVKSDFLTKRKAATATKNNVLLLLGNDEATFKTALDAYGIEEVMGLGGNSPTVGATGIVRRRLSAASVDGNAEADSKGKVSLTHLSTKFGIKGDDLRGIIAKAASVENIRDIPAGTTVPFKIVKDNKTHEVTVTFAEKDAE